MALTINSNVGASSLSKTTNRAQELLNKSLQPLSTGLRINKAADDAAGLAIADRFNTLARQYQAEDRNLQSGISAAQTADSGLSTQQDAVQRIRELAVQASNGTLSDDQRAAINSEAQQLLDQINDTASGTEFNGRQLLNQNQTVSLGVEGGAQLQLQQSDTSSLGLNGLDLSTEAGAAAAIDAADNALEQIGGQRSSIGAQSNGFESAIAQRQESTLNAVESESRIRDVDVARASIERTRNQVLLQSSVAGLLQSNVAPQSALRLLGQ